MAAKTPRKTVELPVLEKFEKAVYGKRYEEAVSLLCHSLNLSRLGCGFAGYDGALDFGATTRFCSAVTALICDPGFKITQTGFDMICQYHPVLDSLYRTSAYGSSDYIFGLVEEGMENVSKFLLAFSLDSPLNLDIEAVFRKDPQATFGLYLALLGHGQAFSPKADERREQLIAMHEIFNDVALDPNLLPVLTSAYMHLSYANGAGKHKPKKLFHKMLSDLVKKNLPKDAVTVPKMSTIVPKMGTIVPKKGKKPTVLIPLEWWWTKHAMFRCYAPAIRSLRKDFRLVGMGRDENTNEHAREIFDEWIVVPEEVNLIEVVKQAAEVKADIIYYPSVGMAVWAVTLASMRLAPVQVMTYGHPATTMSPEMDYGIIDEGSCTPEAFSEKIITIPNDTLAFVPHEKNDTKHVPKRGKPIKIAVSAMQVKVSWPLVKALQDIERRAPRPVEFHFFPSANGVGLRVFGGSIEKLLKKTFVYQGAEYKQYMQWMSECDIALFSFPFGGCNSVIDALQLGLPMVALEGREPHSRTDSVVMRRAGLPEMLVAKSEGEYVETILALFNDKFRHKIAKRVAAVDVKKLFFRKNNGAAFLRTFKDLYGQHSKRKAA